MVKKPGAHQGSITPTKQPAPVKEIMTKLGEKVSPPQPTPPPPAPHEVIKALEGLEKKQPTVLKAEPAGLKWAYDTGYDNGLKIGFAQGIKYIVTLAENKLVEYLGLASRDALAASGQLPPWWIATLIVALDAQAPSIKPSAEISPDKKASPRKEAESVPETEEATC